MAAVPEVDVPWLRLTAALLPVTLLAPILASCSVDRSKYVDRVYACDPGEPNANAECGAGFTCYDGHQIGAQDFCAPACEESDAERYCAPSGAGLQRCDPAAGGSPCGAGLECLRTSITADEGLCLPIEVCTSDADCRDPVRETCMSGGFVETYGEAVKHDHLWCVQSACNDRSPCQAGYSCMGGLLPNSPYVCVPNCNRDGVCPKSLVCASKVLPLMPYDFCIPGFLGFPCESDDHCLMGACSEVGCGVKACTVPCTSTDDCAPFTNGGLSFKCFGGQCVTEASLLMQYYCDPRFDTCPGDSSCGAVGDEGGGYCMRSCATAADCGESCIGCYKDLGADSGTCWPGFPGVMCLSSDDCLEGLECRTWLTFGERCTRSCASDADCQNKQWFEGDWHCGDGICLPQGL